MFGGNFAPRGWAFCDGQLLAVSQNDALFSLLGTIYGGDGRTTFGLPDLRGRIPLHAGQGTGLSNYPLGAKSGAERVTLTTSEIPHHTHYPLASKNPGTQNNAVGNFPAADSGGDQDFTVDSNNNMASDTIENTGGSQSHSNMMPFLAINFIIALVGIYPSRH